MPAVHAQNDPTIEACAKYAEADAAFETAAVKAANDAYGVDPALREAYRAADRKLSDAMYKHGIHSAEHEAIYSEFYAIKERFDATRLAAASAKKAAIEDARTVRTQTYLAIYAEDGGMQSDVWDVMVKLFNHQRNRCTKLYGL